MERLTGSLLILLACVVLAAAGLTAYFVPQIRAAYLCVVDKCNKRKQARQASAAAAMEEGAAAALAPEVLPAKQRASFSNDKIAAPLQQTRSPLPITVVCCTAAEV